MNRPDLDAIESEIRSGYWHLLESEWALLLIAYARHLEARISELEMARTVLPGEVFDQILNDISEGEVEALNRRIFELEAALERKGEQP